MPDPAAEVVAEETEVAEQAEAATEGETLAEAAEKSVAETTEETGGATEAEVDPVQAKIDAAVNKALESQATKLGEARKAAEAAARLEAERDFLRQELERSRNPKKEVVEETIKLPNGFDLLPQEAQEDYLAEKRRTRALEKRIADQEARSVAREKETISNRIESTIEGMKADTENYPGFAEVYPQIEQLGRTDPDFLRAVVSDPKKYLRMAYRDLTAEKAPVLAERELEKKIQKQVKAQTTRPGVRDTGAVRKAVSLEDAFEAAYAKYGGGTE